MLLSLLAATLLAAEPAPIATELWQVAPDCGGKPGAVPAERGEKARAVVLIPGLFVHPVRPARADTPWLRDWQEPRSTLVKALAADFDVFAFSYAQTSPVDEIARSPGMKDAIARLRKAGYTDVVLVGHSTGGVIARLFAEANPDAGVTKVIAVAAPFAGAELANVKFGYPKSQAPFVHSLTPEARAEAAKAADNPPGNAVPLACVVCKLRLVDTDGLVPTRSQWPDDLQKRGVPVALATTHHFLVMTNATAAKTIARLARDKLALWSVEETDAARKVIFGEPKR